MIEMEDFKKELLAIAKELRNKFITLAKETSVEVARKALAILVTTLQNKQTQVNA